MRPDTRSYPSRCFAIDPHDQTGRHEHLPRNHSSRPAEAYRRRIGSPRSIFRHDSSDTAEARNCTASSVSDTDPDVSDPDIVADNATAQCVVRALRAVDAASRVAAAVAVAVDTAPGAVAGTVDPVVAAAASIAATAAVAAGVRTNADPGWTVDGPAGAAVLSAVDELGPAGLESAVFGFFEPGVAVEEPGPAGLESAVFGLYQPGAVAVVVLAGAAAAGLAAPGLAVFVVVAQLSAGSAAAEPAVAEPAAVAVVAVCVLASVGAVGQFFAHSLGRLSPGVTRHP